jgi:hypothetical protein
MSIDMSTAFHSLQATQSDLRDAVQVLIEVAYKAMTILPKLTPFFWASYPF